MPLDAGADHGNPEAIASGRFSFLAEERALGDPPDWVQPGAPRLWQFNLHYFGWAWSLLSWSERARARDAFGRLWRSWRATLPVPAGDPWSPYVASLRLWVLCGIFQGLARGTTIEDDCLRQISWHAGYVSAHLELDIGGNHLLKNIKAMAGAGYFLGRPEMVKRASLLLEQQIPIQVLPDGGHFELSPSYHCQVLGDLIDIESLTAAAGDAQPVGLEAAIDRMRRWLGEMTGSDGEVALFNDSAPVGASQLAALRLIPASNKGVTVLADSGYVVARPGDGSLAILDVGDPCPDVLPGHAHADCLSFELWAGGHRLVVDSATSTYEPVPRRAFERSTRAHNTVEIDGLDQTEVWGVFRAGRRARGHLELARMTDEVVEVVASHDGYQHLPGCPIHRRRWTISPGRMEVVDEIIGGGSHRLLSAVHASVGSRQSLIIRGVGGHEGVGEATTAWGFGNLRPARVHWLDTGPVDLPHQLKWTLEW